MKISFTIMFFFLGYYSLFSQIYPAMTTKDSIITLSCRDKKSPFSKCSNFKEINNKYYFVVHSKKENDLLFQWASDLEVVKFRLLGYDKDWLENAAGVQHTRYTRLKPGKYLFQLFSTNGEINELPIYVQPRFYQTAWFKIALVGAKVSFLIYILQ